MDPYRNYGHMEDFDSLEGDVESRGATIGSTIRFDRDLQAGIRRGQQHARTEQHHHQQMRRKPSSNRQLSPDELMARIMSGGGDDDFSVNTGKVMDDQTYDGRTFDGSTIATNAHHFNKQSYYNGVTGAEQYHRPEPSTSRTMGSDSASIDYGSPRKSKKEEKKKEGCLGLSGKTWLIVALLAALAVITAGVLWFVLYYMPAQSDNSVAAANNALPCCQQRLDDNWSSSTVCSENGDCCRICPAGSDNDSTETTIFEPANESPQVQGGNKIEDTPSAEQETEPTWETGNNQEDADVTVEEEPDQADQILPEPATAPPTTTAPINNPPSVAADDDASDATAGEDDDTDNSLLAVTPSPTPRPSPEPTAGDPVVDSTLATDPPTTPSPTTSAPVTTPEPTPSPTEEEVVTTDPPTTPSPTPAPTEAATAAATDPPTTPAPTSEATQAVSMINMVAGGNLMSGFDDSP